MEKIRISQLFRSDWALPVIAILALVARLYNLNYQSLWIDELHSIVASAPEQSLESIVEYCKRDQPPVSFLYLHIIFKFFPYEASTGRVACMLLGVAAIPVMYLLGREFGTRQTGLFAALITSVDYFHIYYSQELRFYSMTFLLTALSYLYFIRGIKNKRISNFILYIIFTSALLYTHYFGMFVFISQCAAFAFLLFYARWDKRFFTLGLTAGLITAASFIPWMPTVLRDLSIENETFWIKPPVPQFVLQYFYIYTGKNAVTTAILVTLIYFSIKHFRSIRPTHDSMTKGLGWILLFWILLCYLIPYIRSITSTPILHPRYTIIVLPAFFVVYAVGLSSLQNVQLKYVISTVLCFSAAINLLFLRDHYGKITKDQFREASEYVIRANVDKWPVYASLAWHYNFYFKDEPNKVALLPEQAQPQLDHFWILQGPFEEREMAAMLNATEPDFEVVHHEQFFGASAILLKNKKRSP